MKQIWPRPIAAGFAALPAVVVARALASPSQIALHDVRFELGRPTAVATTYGELLERIRGAAATLENAGARPGDRVLLCINRASDFLAFLLGAQCIGVVAVPLPSVTELPLQAYGQRIASVARDAAPSVLVLEDERAGAALPPGLGSLSIQYVAGLEWRTAQLPLGTRFDPERSANELAFLQYTSGSTGVPKGVVVLHRHLLANIEAIGERANVQAHDVVYSWLPLFHDMGLVGGVLLGVYFGLATYVAAPKTFIVRPDSWLRAMSAFRATLSPGPNFAYDLLARRVSPATLEAGERIDLSSWRVALDGGEPVDAETVRAFIDRFATYGFDAGSFLPAYGMAEAVLAIAFNPSGQPPRLEHIDRSVLADRGIAVAQREGTPGCVQLVSSGAAMSGHRVRILAPDEARELPDRELGEVAVSGPSITGGYFDDWLGGRPARGELRTGDLGYLADGQLFLVDRLKDLLIVAGRKFYPSDIERELGELMGVRRGSVIAFSVRGDLGTEELCIAAVLEPKARPRQDAIRAELQRALHAGFGVSATHVLWIRQGEAPKTSSGKVRRSHCAFLLQRVAEASVDA